MIFYAIKDKTTGFFLPQRKSNKGFTSDEPRGDCIPRLFKRKRDAVSALNYWLKGKGELKYTPDTYFSSEEWSIDYEKVLWRMKENMEVVEVSVQESSYARLAQDIPNNYVREKILHAVGKVVNQTL